MIPGHSPLARSRRRISPTPLFVLAATLAAAAAVAVAPAELAFLGALAVAGTVAIYRLPVVSLSALVVAGVGPLVISTTERVPLDWLMLFGKVSPADVILVGMLLCVMLRGAVWLVTLHRSPLAVPSGLVIAYGALFAWIAFSVLRNLGTYGINAPGQFRYSFLVLVAPGYALMFLTTARQRKRFFAFLLVFSVAVPLLAVPIVGQLKGWSVGPSTRFFPAQVSLGMLYGIVALLLTTERGILGFPKWLARLLALPIAALLIADSHRSVWLAGLVLLAYFVLFGRLSSGLFVRIAWLTAAVAALLLTLASLLRLDVLSYISSRASALVDPQGDPTSSWRLNLWAMNLERWRRNPLAGDGFGGYYAGNASVNVPTTIQPHSYYVQTLVTMGVIGMALVLATVAAAVGTLLSVLLRPGRRDARLDTELVRIGLGILFSALAFSIVYAPSYYPGLWVGLALAAAAAVRGVSSDRAADSLS